MNPRKGDDIARRLLEFAANCLRLASDLPDTPSAKHVSRQLTRCSTGGGSNYEEARAAESRADFVHKLAICLKEVRETLFWLRLILQR